MPVAGGERQEALPDARRSARLRSAEGDRNGNYRRRSLAEVDRRTLWIALLASQYARPQSGCSLVEFRSRPSGSEML